MQVRCAFYGLANQAGKTELLIDKACLRPGGLLCYNGDLYVILSVCAEGERFHANVTLERRYRGWGPIRERSTLLKGEHHASLQQTRRGGEGEREQVRLLQEQLVQMERRIQELLGEREAYAKRLDTLIQQLDNLAE